MASESARRQRWTRIQPKRKREKRKRGRSSFLAADLEEATFDLEQSRSSCGLIRPGVVPMGDLQWEVTGSTSLRRIERAIGYRLPEGRFVTIAGVIQEFLQRLAKPGDQCVWGDFQLVVIESPRRGEMLVRMTKLAKEGSEP